MMELYYQAAFTILIMMAIIFLAKGLRRVFFLSYILYYILYCYSKLNKISILDAVLTILTSIIVIVFILILGPFVDYEEYKVLARKHFLEN